MLAESYIVFNYSRADDQVVSGTARGWVSDFEEALRYRLRQLLGAEPVFGGGDSEPRSDGLAENTLLVSILSPHYAESERCHQELRRFLDASEDAKRLFKVMKAPLSPAECPAELQNSLSYDFFATDSETGEPHALSSRAGGEAEGRYWARLTDLAFDISRTLRRPESPEPVEGDAVYLAETSPELHEDRELLRRELLARGHVALPERPLPAAADELEAEVRQDLARCRLSIHPVGSNPGKVLGETGESVIAVQAELAAQHAAEGGCDRLVWMPPGLELVDERQRRFVERLATDARVADGSDFLVTPLERLKLAIVRVLAKRSAPPREKADPADGDAPAQILLVCDQRDLGESRPLREHLEDRGFGVVLPSFDGEEAEVRFDLERKLCFCDAVLIHWGSGSILWLDGNLLEVRKSPGFGRTKPAPPTAIYLATPDGPEKEAYETDAAQILPRTADPAAGIEPFLDRIVQKGPQR